MAQGTWVVRVALFVALLGTAWGTGIMVSSADSVAVSLAPAGTSVHQIVSAATGGATTRVRLSNESTAAPLVVADVRIGRATADPGRALTFDGRPTTTIPAGATIVSDPVDFPVPARSDVTVSVFLPQATGPAPIVTGLAVGRTD
jgi:hypothetical protein